MPLETKVVKPEDVEKRKDRLEEIFAKYNIVPDGENLAALLGIVCGELKRIEVSRAAFLEWAAHVWDSVDLVPNEDRNGDKPRGTVH